MFCDLPNGPAPSPNRSFTHAQGYLVAVPGYASSLTYHPSGMIANVVHSNGLTDVWDEDLGRPRPSRISVTGTVATSLGDHSYDGSGNLVRRRFAGVFDDHYTYDGLNRIKVFEDSSGDQGYQYDPFGNLTGITGVNGRTLATNRATNRLSGAVVYDGRGNILAWGSQLYSYDALGMMSTRNYPEDTYIYTADEERLWTFHWQGSFESLVETWTVRDLDAKVLTIFENPKGTTPWSFLKDYVYRGGQQLAADTHLASPRSRQHFSLDHLGSARLTTDRNGTPIFSHNYYPYGEEVGAAFDSEQLRFTGHERDFAGGTYDLDYMHARHCSPQLGRFLSVDPILSSDVQSPQSWNRFAYALGNPLAFIDEDGLEVTYSTENLRKFYEKAAAKNSLAAATLELFSGDLNLAIREVSGSLGTAEGQLIAGEFVATLTDVSYDGNIDEMDAKIKQGAAVFFDSTPEYVTGVTYSKNTTISLVKAADAQAKLHELGHADQFARDRLQFFNDSHKATRSNRARNKQPGEMYATKYSNSTLSDSQSREMSRLAPVVSGKQT